jgi:hypothetical protein
MKKNTGARWEVADGKPLTHDHDRQRAVEAAEYLKLKTDARG